ncbi:MULTISPECIES: 2-dehydro-3-deoxygalactonokinase [unclassified Duganella]|uniref:2-dehydro-3-deoxygalactonokinase n=1 Tax=unclassified Duganella TaxID=2636909 RepID=UPI00087F3B6A|nr:MULTISPECIES: 2-dehydro-3-deoxygalactonokinase [unclassified Duganella]SDF97338.1 2-dehydro-3-deoxygalactonokinase [Duganella sp. OV458]SDJ07332.1 2-dehydro-3-deoxygalactonokinase [Duganella sp. OV510]
MNKHILGIDWGTSNRRAYLIDQSGACLAEHDDGQGMLAVGGREQFGASLAGLLAAMKLPADVPVIMSGMVGSASGWQEVDYLDASVPLEELPRHLAAVTDPAWAGRATIVPGYVYRNGTSADVMRGEETQLLGAVALGHRDGWIVLPGTHSKWVLLRDGVIQSIATYMTGELFAMLSKGGTLSAMLTGDAADAAGFATGLAQAARNEPLSNSLFRVRAGVVSRSAPAGQAAATISGLLIGAEFAAAARAAEGQGITVIGSPALAARYEIAAQHFGLKCAVLDPHQVYCTAVSQFLKDRP